MRNFVLGLHIAAEEAGKFSSVTGQLCVQGKKGFSIQTEGEETLQDHYQFLSQEKKGNRLTVGETEKWLSECTCADV